MLEMSATLKENIVIYGTILGIALSLGWISYMIYQQRKVDRAQRSILQSLENESRKMEQMLTRLRNLEVSQCANPAISSNPALFEQLRCPPTTATPLPNATGALAQTVPLPQNMPGFGMQSGNIMVTAPQQPNMPPLPNYGFFGQGPAGLSEQYNNPMQHMMRDSPNIPVPFR